MLGKKLVWRIPKKVLVLLLKSRFKSRFRFKFKLGVEDNLLFVKEINDYNQVSDIIYFYHPLRVQLYFSGIQNRLDKLSNEYCIDLLETLPEGLIIDVGSNIGEFTLALSRKFSNRKFIRFEPSENENIAAQKNLVGVDNLLINQPLYSHETTLRWWEANETGDSSLFRPVKSNSSQIRTTTTLDIVFNAFNYPNIALLKLEAEGAEPEILRGARRTLKNTFAVTADLGPERGSEGLRTFNESAEILNSAGFSLIGRNRGSRECFLFVNNVYVK